MRRLLAVVLLTGALLPSTASAHSRLVIEGYFAHHCTAQTVKGIEACLHRAAIHYHQSYHEMHYIAWRESRLNSYATKWCPVNPQPVADGEHATGLVQFIPSTWDDTPYRHHDICDAKWSSLAMGWMWAHGRKGDWGL